MVAGLRQTTREALADPTLRVDVLVLRRLSRSDGGGIRRATAVRQWRRAGVCPHHVRFLVDRRRNRGIYSLPLP